MLTKQQIQAIIKSQGLRATFRTPPMKGDGTTITYVRAKNTQQHIFISLGRIEQIAKMSQDALVETIQRKFAEKLAKKLQTTSPTELKNGLVANPTKEDSSITIHR